MSEADDLDTIVTQLSARAPRPARVEGQTARLCGWLEHVEVGVDAPDFPTALRAAPRQASDVIVGGEMRDPETMQIAVAGGETGHLVSDKQWPRLMTRRKSEATFRREGGHQCVAAHDYSLLSRGTLILPESSRSSVKGRAH